MSEPLVQPEPMTFEGAALLDPDRMPGELHQGEWQPVTRSTWRHGEIVANVTALLAQYARSHREWSVASGDPGTRLERDPDTLRGPDVGIVRRERRPAGRGQEGWLDGAPELAVEVLGDGQTTSQLARKCLEYLTAGSRQVWLLDADSELLLLFTPPNQIRILGPDDVFDGGDLLPGFSCPVREFFV